MNEKEKEAIEFIKDLISWDVGFSQYPDKEDCEKLEAILNLIEKQKAEIEDKQDEINVLEAQKESIENQFEQAKIEIEKKDEEYEELTEASKELCKTVNLMKKVINEMAEYIIDLIKYNNSEEERDKEEIKEYFTNKVEKEGIKDNEQSR